MEKMIFSYDDESDIMYFSIGEPKNGIDSEIEDGIFIRQDENHQNILGIMIIDFKKRFKNKSEYSIPIEFDNIKLSHKEYA